MAEGGDVVESWNSEEFVGREEIMDWLKEKYSTRQSSGDPQSHRYRIYGIHGKKGIGKSCVMQKFLQQIQHDTSRNRLVHVGPFNFDQVKSFRSFLDILCNFFGVKMHKWRKESGNNNNNDEEEEEDFMDCMSQIEEKMNFKQSDKFIVFLDNMEGACGKAKTDGTPPDMSKKLLWDKIYGEFILNLLPKCHNLLVFITSTQTAKFAKFNRIACNVDLKEMTENEAKCLLKNQVSGAIEEEKLSSIVRLCDGLPLTIIKAANMLCDGEYSHDEIEDLLKDFDKKMDLHGDDLFPKDDRYDEQLKKFINRLSDQNKRNLRTLAEMIDVRGQVGIEEAASELNSEGSTAVFKLRFLLPLRFRGMVEVDMTTGQISMNTFFCQFIMSHIKGKVGKEDTAGPPRGHAQPTGGQKGPHGPDKIPSDDSDDSDDQGPAANHLILPSHHTQDKSSRLLEEENADGKVGKEDTAGPPRGHAQPTGGQKGPHGPDKIPSDDSDDSDDQGPAADHLILPSHHTQDKSSRLLEEENADDDADDNSKAGKHTTVPSHHTQDASSHLIEEVSMSQKQEPNVAKMEGQHVGNRDEKPHYDILVTNQGSVESDNTLMGDTPMRENDLSPEESTYDNIPRNIAGPNHGNNPENRSFPEDGVSNSSKIKSDLGSIGKRRSEEEMVTYKESSGEGLISNKQCSGEGRIANIQVSTEKVKNVQSSGGEKVTNEQKACTIKRFNTLEENTMDMCKTQAHKDISMTMNSVEENYYQPAQVSDPFDADIPEKKTNRAGSLDDNSQQDHGPLPSNLEKGKRFQEMSSRFPAVTKSYDLGKDGTGMCRNVGHISSERSATAYDTEDDHASETLVKRPYSNKSVSGHITALSQDCLPDTCMTDISGHLASQQFDAMSYLGSADFDDPLNSSFKSDRLFESGRYDALSVIHNVGQDELPKSQSLDDKDVLCTPPHMVPATRKSDGQTLNRQQRCSDIIHDEAHPVDTAAVKYTVLHGYQRQENEKSQRASHLSQTGPQEMSRADRDLGIEPTTEPRTVPSVQNKTKPTPSGSSNNGTLSQPNSGIGADVKQEESGMFASISQFFSETFQAFKEMES